MRLYLVVKQTTGTLWQKFPSFNSIIPPKLLNATTHTFECAY